MKALLITILLVTFSVSSVAQSLFTPLKPIKVDIWDANNEAAIIARVALRHPPFALISEARQRRKVRSVIELQAQKRTLITESEIVIGNVIREIEEGMQI